MCYVNIVSFPLTVQCCVSAAGIGGLACRPSLIFEAALTNMTMKFICYNLVKGHVKSVVIICYGTFTWTGLARGIACVPNMAFSVVSLPFLCSVYRNVMRLSTHETKNPNSGLQMCIKAFYLPTDAQ